MFHWLLFGGTEGTVPKREAFFFEKLHKLLHKKLYFHHRLEKDLLKTVVFPSIFRKLKKGVRSALWWFTGYHLEEMSARHPSEKLSFPKVT